MSATLFDLIRRKRAQIEFHPLKSPHAIQHTAKRIVTEILRRLYICLREVRSQVK
jgi:hypothetical protein